MAIVQYRQVDFISANYPPDQLRVAGPGRRLAGALLDYMFLVPAQFSIWLALWWSLIAAYDPDQAGVATGFWFVAGGLFFGWLAWFAYAAVNGQSPGKQLLGMYVMKGDGTRAGGGYMWLRELIVKHFLTLVLNTLTFGVYWIIAALWCLWDRDNQCLWDKMASTHVAWSPSGYKPQTDAEISAGAVPQPVGQRAPVGGAFAPTEPRPRANAASARISVFDAGRNMGEFQFEPGQTMTIGRGGGVDISLSDPRASRKHLEIAASPAGWNIRDLGSTNPAQVIAGGTPHEVRGSELIRAGQLAIGDSIITLYPPTNPLDLT